jgi:hypothetical protein
VTVVLARTLLGAGTRTHPRREVFG